jgi:hypothetical protein
MKHHLCLSVLYNTQRCVPDLMGHQIQTAPGETFPPAEKPADSPVDMLEIDVESPHDSIEVLNYLKGWPLHSLTISSV